MKLNPVVADHPNLIYAGTVLQLPMVAAVPSDAAVSTYTVRHGDSLSKIARDQLGDAGRWPDLVALNPAVADHPNLIYAGTVLQLPQAEVFADDVAAAADVQEPSSAAMPQTAPPARAPSAHSDLDAAAPGASEEDPAPDGPAQELPTEAAPPTVAEPVPAGATQVRAVDDDGVGDPGIAPWVLAGLTGGGALLAGSLLLALRRRRRAQFRHRRPGRTFAAPDPVLAPVEKTILSIGSLTAPTVEHVDAILRRLAAAACAGPRRDAGCRCS